MDNSLKTFEKNSKIYFSFQSFFYSPSLAQNDAILKSKNSKKEEKRRFKKVDKKENFYASIKDFSNIKEIDKLLFIEKPS